MSVTKKSTELGGKLCFPAMFMYAKETGCWLFLEQKGLASVIFINSYHLKSNNLF